MVRSDIAGLLWLKVIVADKLYNRGVTGCPFYLDQRLVPFLFFN